MYRLRHKPMQPWIEGLVLNYSDREGEEAGAPDGDRTPGRKRWLKAYVLEVSHLPESKLRAFEGPNVVLFLSDGQVKIPAVLTASAWARIQEEEGRENLNNFLNATVHLQVERLQFDVTPDKFTSRFYLVLSGLSTVEAGLVRQHTPCYTSLPSIRMKIDQTWSARQRAQDSQRSHDEPDLSQLLWQEEWLRSSVNDVVERMTTHTTPQPSASAYHSSITGPATSWDQDRVRYQAETPFTVPVRFLLIPQHLETGTDAGLRTHTGTELAAHNDATGQIPEPAGVESVRDAEESSAVLTEDDFPQEEVTRRPTSNPWDIYPPPCISSESSPEPTPTLSGTTSGPDSATMVTSSPYVQISLPPYQKQQNSSILPTNSAEKSLPEPPASDTTQNTRTHQNLQALDRDYQDRAQVDTRNLKRKRHDVPLQRVEEEEFSHSPPSWLFETQPEPARTKEGSGPKQRAVRTTSSVHIDGKRFSYTYSVTGQNLQDFSRFRVAASVLHWAVKYLLTPKPAEPPPNIS
ncbi:adrenocortical dysplasia protein homolog [Nothobranchius furzeri]|uniref:ACD shelterin complex subunit and telomerase recruitment factor n=1 Tax=Nothobranchius furzeri TaxID=105023 RepID=A0A1A8AZ20_NOTFU|nr:putative LOC107389161-like protein [Nothobranchius furzeri]